MKHALALSVVCKISLASAPAAVALRRNSEAGDAAIPRVSTAFIAGSEC
jgi:hypothetical protein